MRPASSPCSPPLLIGRATRRGSSKGRSGAPTRGGAFGVTFAQMNSYLHIPHGRLTLLLYFVLRISSLPGDLVPRSHLCSKPPVTVLDLISPGSGIYSSKLPALAQTMTTMDGLQERFRSTGLTDTRPSPSDQVSLQQRRAVSTPVPRYLFRVFTRHSDGSTDKNWVKSKDFVAGLASATQDVSESTTPQDTAKNIWGHLKWMSFANDNLMSWTSSLLFAIQYIFYRHADNRDRSDFRDINILVVDTNGLPEGAFIRDIELINAFSKHDENLADFERFRSSRFYFGEYLSQGALNIRGRSEVVSAQDMFDAGLLELRDEFQQSYATSKWEWANKVLELREAYTRNDVLQNVSPQQIQVAVTVGRLFGRKFRLPIGFQLTAICSGCLKVEIVAPAFENEFFTGEIR